MYIKNMFNMFRSIPSRRLLTVSSSLLSISLYTLSTSHQESYCLRDRWNSDDISILNKSSSGGNISNERDGEMYHLKNSQTALCRTFVADAAAIASPSVVNIRSQNHLGLSTGSGFVISPDGFVVTNAHVVDKALDKQVNLTLWDGKQCTGYVHSTDNATDLALVKINENDFSSVETMPVSKIGSSQLLRAGEFVLALGSPVFLQGSVSFGIVSAIARQGSELGLDSRNEYIQTDTAVNVGNSGGPLVNLDGEVVGVNSLQYKGADGIAFAIPIDTVMPIVNQLKQNKRVIRPYIGLKIKTVRNNSAPSSDVKIVTVEVLSDSPASIAGIEPGDIILAVDNKPIRKTKDIYEAIGFEVGRSIPFLLKKAKTGAEVNTYLVSAPEKVRSKRLF